jgi:Pup amidohydrolase
MFRLMGIETEYGFSVAGRGPEYQALEAAELLRALPFMHFPKWDRTDENPLQDLRGFRVQSLVADPHDAHYDRQGPLPASSPPVQVERLLTNGARLYNDHGHPEYSTPECAHLVDLVAHDRAGESILLACKKNLERDYRAARVFLYKNNTDYHGSSYGCHENYLLPRLSVLGIEKLLEGLLPFLVTRQIFAGAGKVGIEPEDDPHAGSSILQLSQRADHFSTIIGVDTLYARPLLNTRDEPHADPMRFMRLHVIAGDANRSQFATALKMGATALVLEALAGVWAPNLALADPVGAMKEISRDQSRQWSVPLQNGQRTSAIDIQRLYLDAARTRAQQNAAEDAEVRWLLEIWEETLTTLAADPLVLADRLDWAAKAKLIDTFLAEGGADDLEVLQSLDLAYHDLDPSTSLFAGLEENGEMMRIVSDAAVVQAQELAPAGTRAAIRGTAIRRFCAELTGISWARIRAQSGDLELGKLVSGSLEELNQKVNQAHSLTEMAAAVKRYENEPQSR